MDYVTLAHATNRALSVVVQEPFESEDALNDNKDSMEDERLSFPFHERETGWHRELLDGDRYEALKNGEFEMLAIPLLLVFIIECAQVGATGNRMMSSGSGGGSSLLHRCHQRCITSGSMVLVLPALVLRLLSPNMTRSTSPQFLKKG